MRQSKKQPLETPQIGTEQMRMLAKLSNACAVSGDEGEVRAFIVEQLKTRAIDYSKDSLGNLIVIKKGLSQNCLRVMVAAHMDEVGLILTYNEDKEEGVFRFETVGGISIQNIVSKPFWIGKKHIPGIIAGKHFHKTTKEELSKPYLHDSLRMDVGSENASEVEVGDRATFATTFRRLGPSLCGKALDNRLGVVSLIEILKNHPPNIDLLAVFTVQEEVGPRGSRTAAFSLDPDIAIVIDCTLANDLPSSEHDEHYKQENAQYNSRLGAGPAIYLADSHTISDKRLVEHFVTTARMNSIPFQYRQPGGGSTDAGEIHLQKEGIPSISISVPGRYLHTSSSIIRLVDWQNTFQLIYKSLASLSTDVIDRKS
jgi:putative aminopeptidase FrvX